MRKLFFLLSVVGVAVASSAEQSWVAAYVGAYDDQGGTENLGYYSAYYCTKDGASSVFDGAQDAAEIATYLTKNFSATTALLEDRTKYPKPTQPIAKAAAVQNLGDPLWLTYGEYQFELGLLDPADADGFAVLFFDNKDGDQAFCVYDSSYLDTLAAANGNLAYQAELGEKVWQSVPEPTSALLLLLGVAGLALRRNRAQPR